MRPPPAARARGNRASGSLTRACGRAWRSDLEATQRFLEPFADVREVLARRRDARHGGGLLLHDGAHLLRGGRVRLGGRCEVLDLLGERLRLVALRVGRIDDALDGGARRGDLTVDLRQRIGGRADDRLADGDSVAGLNDLFLGADGARADLRSELPDLVERPRALARELAN